MGWMLKLTAGDKNSLPGGFMGNLPPGFDMSKIQAQMKDRQQVVE